MGASILGVGAAHRMANELGVSDRTIRRAVALGLVRGVYMTQRGLYLAPDEIEYLRRQWTTLDRLRRALRNEPVVEFALLYGAAARRRPAPAVGFGTLRLLLSTRRRGPDALPRLHAKLTRATRQSVVLVRFDSVADQPTLLLEAIRDGRVLVDRRGTAWSKLKRQRWRLLREERGLGPPLPSAFSLGGPCSR